MKIGLFGGTFNPPHIGHIKLAEEFREYLSLDKIIIMPVNIPPHKIPSTDTPHSSGDRLNMCRLAFDKEYFLVSDIEISRGGPSFTYDTLLELKKLYPGARIYLLIGSDMLFYFDKWHRYNEILELCTLCAVSRTKDEDHSVMRAFAREVLGDTEDKIIIMETEPCEISSSLIREKAAAGESAGAYVPESVSAYIKAKGLYGAGVR